MATADRSPGAAARVRALFDAAVELPLAERQHFLAALDEEDEALRDELIPLLEAHDRATGFLEDSALPGLGGGLDPERLIGERFGDYRVERLLGRGGMGTVFLAQRADGAYRQTVAIKLLDHLDEESRSVLRFERERQTLAKLTHPNIARLLDGGTTEDGTPFLVMEYVEGEHIDRFCDDRRLDVSERLRLFLQVCAGVQHAHRHLVVHRDLKPSNILVTPDGEVKLLDFGIAKLLDELEPEAEPADPTAPPEEPLAPALTVVGGRAFTPEYASPEQLRGEEVSAASDVFALGTVLYELLCGSHPFARHRGDPGAISAAVLAGETPTPSQALAESLAGEGLPGQEVAAQRGVDLSRLRRRVRGDLDAILLKAMAKEETRRYASAGELALDIERHLGHRPVAARAGERGYVAGRFVRRHRLAVGAAALLLLSLVAGLATTAWQAARAERAQAVAEHRFEQVQELAGSLLFDVHDAVARLPGATPVRHLLVERALAYLDSLRADAEGDASLQLDLADAYERIGDIQGNPNQANLGDTAAAAESYRAALALRLDQPEETRREPEVWASIAGTRHRIGEVLWWTGDVEEAGRQVEVAIDEWRRLAAADPERAEWRRHWAESLTFSARVMSWNGEHDEALDRFRAAEELLTPLVEGGGRGRPQEVVEAIALVHQGRGETLSWMGETDRSLDELERARRLLAELSARHPLDTPLRRRHYLAALRHSRTLAERSSAEAIASFDETLALARELATADPANALARRDLSLAHASFGDVLSNAGEQDSALEHFRQAQAVQRQLALEDPNNLGHQEDLANSAVRIGYVLGEEGDHVGALASFDEALDLRLPIAATDPDDAGNARDIAVIHSARGDSLAALGDRGAACTAYRESLSLWQELDRSGQLREYDRPQLDHAVAGVGDACSGEPGGR